MRHPMASRTHRLWALALPPAVLAAGLLLHGPIPQDPAYHAFADARAIAGIPNAWNVLSNLAFTLAGLLGLAFGVVGLPDPALRRAFAVFFAAVAAVGAGSAYYHLAPDDPRLFWDRLPMTLGFAGLLGAVLIERVGKRLGTQVMGALLVLGPLSAVLWRLTGDLRTYAIVQYAPLLALPMALALFPGPAGSGTGYLGALGFYALAKVCEMQDAAIFTLTAGTVSGHALKHALAAAAAVWILRMLRARPAQEQALAEEG